MKKETYEAQKAFAGEKKPSMLRRCVDHDYTDRQIYMITMVTEGRRALFGHVVGKSEAPVGSPDEPHIELSALGKSSLSEKKWKNRLAWRCAGLSKAVTSITASWC